MMMMAAPTLKSESTYLQKTGLLETIIHFFSDVAANYFLFFGKETGKLLICFDGLLCGNFPKVLSHTTFTFFCLERKDNCLLLSRPFVPEFFPIFCLGGPDADDSAEAKTINTRLPVSNSIM
jgi:hypothetical protein